MSKTITINPFNRVEGDLKIRLELDNNLVTDARAAGSMFRGFEKILRNHSPEDALVYTPRICGICCISHSVAAALALEAIAEPFASSRSGIIARNMAHATENAMSHITQFYLYFAPDMLNRKYKSLSFYETLKARLAPLEGSSVRTIIAERKRFLEILGNLVGKWPHTLAIHPGGTTLSLDASQLFRIKGILTEFITKVESLLYGMPLADYAALRTAADLQRAYGSGKAAESDLGLFLRFAGPAGLMNMGAGPSRFLSAGAYRQPGGDCFLPAGYFDAGCRPLDPTQISEAIRYSFFESSAGPLDPFHDVSEPALNKPGAYSWSKAPRYGGEVVEVGALGRQVISGDPLMLDLFSLHGSSVFTRVFARIHEAARLLQAMHSWIDMLDDRENYFAPYILRQEGSGIGMTEAARGFLGHWLRVERGKIINYQVITPTAWNCSPRDDQGSPGAVEDSLTRTVLADPENPVEIDHIIRSYDPCLVCTVH